jgi:hypothetical protein
MGGGIGCDRCQRTPSGTIRRNLDGKPILVIGVVFPGQLNGGRGRALARQLERGHQGRTGGIAAASCED